MKKLLCLVLLCIFGFVFLGHRKAFPEMTQSAGKERKPVNREILESAERLSRTLENCKTTVKTNSVTR